MNNYSRNRRADITDGVESTHVDLALEEWKTIGSKRFHAKYKTNPAEKFVIVDFEGVEFDAKAILIAARSYAGLSGKNEDFRGERRTVAVPLANLGYMVEDLSEELIDDELISLQGQEKAIALARRFAGQTDSIALRTVRREQRILRVALGLSGGLNSCALCARSFPSRFLVAAHIKRRSECSETERVDIPAVALIACAFGCDVLFEHGVIAIDSDGLIFRCRIGQSLNPEIDVIVDGLIGKKALIGPESEKYVAWHREYWRHQPVQK